MSSESQQDINTMPSIHKVDIGCILVIVVCLIMGLTSLPTVPFHPDEATQMFTSADLEQVFSNPSSLAWSPAGTPGSRLVYRLLDAPITRILVGIGRQLFKVPAPLVDWNWSATWEENLVAGAVPSRILLVSSRLIPTLLLPLSLILIYLPFRKVGKPWVGITSIVLLATNPLILLHGRRAMAEPAMIFALSLFFFVLSVAPRKPLWIALASAIAFNAKQSLFILAPVGYLFVIWDIRSARVTFNKILASTILYLVTILAVTVLLNPFLWKDPIGAVKSAWQARQDLLSRQIEDLQRIAPERLASTPIQAAGLLLGQALLAPPAAEDIANYHKNLLSSEEAYFMYPPHRWMRGLVWGGIFLFISTAGFVLWPLRRDLTKSQRLLFRCLAWVSLAVFISLALIIPIPYQRYSIPVVFYGCLWTAVGGEAVLAPIISTIAKQIIPINKPSMFK